jgi:hypothetical protein
MKDRASEQNDLKVITPPTLLILFNDMLKSLQRYNIEQNHRILHRVAQRLSKRKLKISQYDIFKIFVKKKQ